MKLLGKGIKAILWVALLFLVYVVICLVHGTVTDYQPQAEIKLDVSGESSATLTDSIITLANWNIGYCGLGSNSTFFYDDGRMFTSGPYNVRSSKEMVEGHLKGVLDFIRAEPADFYLLQEVDQRSRRSYKINAHEKVSELLPNYSNTFAPNYKVARVPIPVLQPWNVMGKMHSGLSTYSKYPLTESIRYQSPGKYDWPIRIFQLDRCFSTHRIQHSSGNELVVINTHNSAYDGGVLKKQEMELLKEVVLKEYQKGNYVIVGGDWNQCPPGFQFDQFRPGMSAEGYSQDNISASYLPSDWTWAFDASVPTNRKLPETYQGAKTFVTLIDYYLVSPNVEVVEVRGVDQQFQFSDHQPVMLKVKLK